MARALLCNASDTAGRAATPASWNFLPPRAARGDSFIRLLERNPYFLLIFLVSRFTLLNVSIG